MSESSNEATKSNDDETGLIPDEDLPEDLQPDKNPLAADPDDESAGDGSDGSGDEAPKVEGMPDMGQPG
jgi:hypothetical protein